MEGVRNQSQAVAQDAVEQLDEGTGEVNQQEEEYTAGFLALKYGAKGQAEDENAVGRNTNVAVSLTDAKKARQLHQRLLGR